MTDQPELFEANDDTVTRVPLWNELDDAYMAFVRREQAFRASDVYARWQVCQKHARWAESERDFYAFLHSINPLRWQAERDAAQRFVDAWQAAAQRIRDDWERGQL